MKKSFCIIIIIQLIFVNIFTMNSFSNDILVNVKENKVYSKNLDLSTKELSIKDLNIDDKRLIEKSKEILKDVYNNVDIDTYEIKFDLFSDSKLFVCFLKNNVIEYYVGYNLKAGYFSYIFNQDKTDSKNISKEKAKNLQELRLYTKDYFKKVKIFNLDQYKLVSEHESEGYYSAEYKHEVFNKTIKISINPYTGELLSLKIEDAI